MGSFPWLRSALFCRLRGMFAVPSPLSTSPHCLACFHELSFLLHLCWPPATHVGSYAQQFFLLTVGLCLRMHFCLVSFEHPWGPNSQALSDVSTCSKSSLQSSPRRTLLYGGPLGFAGNTCRLSGDWDVHWMLFAFLLVLHSAQRLLQSRV